MPPPPPPAVDATRPGPGVGVDVIPQRYATGYRRGTRLSGLPGNVEAMAEES